QYDAGEIKVLAHNGENAVQGFEGVESFRDIGVDVGFSVWRALVLPKDTPAEIVAGWDEILRNTMEDPALKEAYAAVAIGYEYRDSAATKTFVDEAAVQLGVISREAGIVKE